MREGHDLRVPVDIHASAALGVAVVADDVSGVVCWNVQRVSQ